MTTNTKLLDSLVKKIKKAGEIIKVEAQKPREIKHKGPIDLVTSTDLAVEHFLKEELLKLLPDSNFLAEESSAKNTLKDYTWIIDPIDGTTNYAHNLPVVSTSVGLWVNNEIILGVVNAPFLHECFTAIKGRGAFLNSKKISVSSINQMQDSLIATGFPYAIEEFLPDIIRMMNKVLPKCQGIRRFGSAALDLAYVASGRFDGYYERCLNPWDISAGWLLVEEAGGKMTKLDGNKFTIDSPDLLATNSFIHEQLKELVN